jgi:hydroxyacylglutathione hydrolase
MTSNISIGYELRKHAIEVPYMRGDNNDVYIYEAVLNNNLILFDTGPDTEQARRYLMDTLDHDRMSYVFITHCHPDHAGLMSFLQESFGIRVVVSRYDIFRYEQLHVRMAALPGILGPHGFPAEEISRLQRLQVKVNQQMVLPDDYLILEDSQTLLVELGLSYCYCPGHSQSDIVYLFGDYAVTGDVVLQGLFTTPLLDIDPENMDCRYDNYMHYCETIVRLRGLEGRTLLPSHLKPLNGIDSAVLFYVTKLMSRAREIAVQRHAGKSAYDILTTLLGRQAKNTILLYFKISELLFIIDFLEQPGLLAAALHKIGLYDQLKPQFEEFL